MNRDRLDWSEMKQLDGLKQQNYLEKQLLNGMKYDRFNSLYSKYDWEDTLEHQLGRRSLFQHSGTSTWLPKSRGLRCISTWPVIIVPTLWNINLAADHWNNAFVHQLGRRSLEKHSCRSSWPKIFGTTLSNINYGI
ncbi:hypothetical protein BLOT_010034 [Blomia tropicalis]|nr:hypothetical protein BLOT_010034 [Blomia tropicalis]